MPVEFRYDREKEVLFGTMTSPLMPEEIEAALKDITRSDQFPPDTNVLWDMRKVDFSALDRNFEESLINIQKKFPERGRARVAWIAAEDHAFAMGRMYEALAHDLPRQMRVFRSYTKAEDWLLRP
jgi:hypothetical protein